MSGCGTWLFAPERPMQAASRDDCVRMPLDFQPSNSITRQLEDLMGMLQEFKEFAVKGNVIDLAVAVIIGGAFQAIVNSLVKDIDRKSVV